LIVQLCRNERGGLGAELCEVDEDGGKRRDEMETVLEVRKLTWR